MFLGLCRQDPRCPLDHSTAQGPKTGLGDRVCRTGGRQKGCVRHLGVGSVKFLSREPRQKAKLTSPVSPFSVFSNMCLT